ncbi:50S ribosomal protein L24 [Candidatus Uhrbacteria bacterium]|nr:50S ribosomal protein L24 [Candidatus Uhrbacteria bacterium]
MKMKIKKNDKVIVIVGKDKGKSGTVLRAIPALGKIVVEGVNIKTKHVRVRRQGEKGQKIFFPAALNVSNVKLVCPKCGVPTRVGYRMLDSRDAVLKQKKDRMCKKCKQPINQ